MFPGLDLYYADPAQPLTAADEELDDLGHDLPEVWNILVRKPSETKMLNLGNARSLTPLLLILTLTWRRRPSLSHVCSSSFFSVFVPVHSSAFVPVHSS